MVGLAQRLETIIGIAGRDRRQDQDGDEMGQSREQKHRHHPR